MIECEGISGLEVKATATRGGQQPPSVSLFAIESDGQPVFAVRLSVDQAHQALDQLFQAIELLELEAVEAADATRQ